MDLSSVTKPILDEWNSARADGRVTVREFSAVVWRAIETLCFAVANEALKSDEKRKAVSENLKAFILAAWPKLAASYFVVRYLGWIPFANPKGVALLIADGLLDLIYQKAVKPYLDADDTQIALEKPQ